jgi:hypothetical protein
LLEASMSRLSTIQTAVAVALAAGGAGVAALTPAHAGAGLVCEIQATHGSSGVTLEGFVTASRAAAGSYQLIVTQAGRAGSSDIAQDGDFSVSAGGSARLGTVVLDGTGAYSARLKLVANGNSVACRDRGRI